LIIWLLQVVAVEVVNIMVAQVVAALEDFYFLLIIL
jgi:hypothetical protein